jgi:exonuclease III
MPHFAGYKTAASCNRSVDKVHGGGVAILVSKSMTVSDISPDIDDIAAIEICAGTSKYAVVSYYCPPDNRDLDTDTLEQYIRQYDRVIIAGDLNAKHQYFGSRCTDSRGEQLFDFVERNDLVVLNDPNQMTRHVVSTGYSDLIDYIIVSKQVSSRFKECYSGECIGSDHLPIHLKLQLACQIDKVPTKQVRILAKCDWTLFNDSLIEANNHYHTNALDSEVAIDARCDEIRQSITQAIDLACPKRIVKDYAFRLSADTVNLIRLKRKLRRKSQKSNDPSYRTLYDKKL